MSDHGAGACLITGLALGASAELTYRFKFDGSVSGSTVDGTYTEKPQYTADVPAGGQLASSIEVGMNAGLKKSGFQLSSTVIANQGSISLWVNPDSLALSEYVLNLPGGLFLAALDGSTIALSDGAFNWMPAAVSAGVWTHVVATWDNTANTIQYYINGSAVASGTLGVPVTSIYTLRVGGYDVDDVAGAEANQYNGKMYDMQIYDHVLGTTEITQLYGNPGTTISSASGANLAHRYTFDGNVTDAVAALNGNPSVDGTYSEAPQFVADTPSGTLSGAPAQSMEVGMSYGTKKSGFMLLDTSVLNTNAGSFSVWLKPDALTGGNYSLTSPGGLSLLSENDSTFSLFTGGGRVGFESVTAGAWTHVVGAWDAVADTATYYVNGAFVGSISNIMAIESVNGVRVGAYDVGDYAGGEANQFDGKMYDLQFYDGKLNAADAASLYVNPGSTTGITDPGGALIHRYDFLNDVNDVVGSINGIPTTDATVQEAVAYSTDLPVGTVTNAPTHALNVGMSYGTKKSGFELSNSVISTNRGTISLWVNPDSLVTGTYALNLPGGLMLATLNGTSLALSDGSFNWMPAAVSVGTWNHVVATWDNDANTIQYYLNGSLAASSSLGTPVTSTYALRVGGYDLSDIAGAEANQFDGKLYDLQIYNKVLTPDDILWLTENPGSPPLSISEEKPRDFVVLPDQTIVASAVVTNAPYSADSTGAQDATTAIQSAINAVASQGGGVVFIPAGQYRVSGNLTLGYDVVLQGGGAAPDGTVLLAFVGRGDTNAAPFIQTVASEVGLMDLCIYYPEQTPSDIQPYPSTIKVSYGASTLRNILLCNSYTGIEFNNFNASVVEQVRGTVLKRGIYAPFSSEFGWMRDVDFSNTYWEEAVEAFEGAPMSAAEREALGNYTRQNLIGLELQRLDGLVVDGFRADDALRPVFMQPNTNYPNNVFGFGGVVHDFPEVRSEKGWAPWYYGMHYANLDNVPEVNGKQYEFAAVPQPARTDVFLDVMDRPYSAAGDGVADDTFSIQQALSDAGALGGGTVYLPPGIYKVTTPLTVPDGVELRGSEGKGKVREFAGTCTLASGYGHDTPNPLTDTALITLGNHAGVRGFSIVHLLQPYDPAEIKPTPYDIRGNGSGAWIVDMVLVNSWFGIDLASNRNDDFLVRDLWGTPYYKGIDVGGGSVGGKLERTAFSVGPVWSTGWYSDQRTPELQDAVYEFIKTNSLFYSFGASSNLTAWGLAGFGPDVQCHFYEQSGGSTADAEFWMTMLDAPGSVSIQADQAADVRWYGFFATGDDPDVNWLEVDSSFQGPMGFYGKTIHQSHQPNPLVFTQQQARFFDEVSLTTGKAASANQTDAGSAPANAVDRNPRTLWEAPAGSYLEVDLGEVMDIDRFEVESGLFDAAANKITRAVLQVSTNGTTFFTVAINTTTAYWMSMPIANTPARYVRLYAENAAGPVKVASFNLFNTSATVRPVVGLSPAEPATLQWASWPGHTYSIWHTDSLTNGFTEIATGINGTGATLEFTDPDADIYDTSFYRLKAHSND